MLLRCFEQLLVLLLKFIREHRQLRHELAHRNAIERNDLGEGFVLQTLVGLVFVLELLDLVEEQVETRESEQVLAEEAQLRVKMQGARTELFSIDQHLLCLLMLALDQR